MKLNRNYGVHHQGSSQERASDKYSRPSNSLSRAVLLSLLCFAALVLGFRLSHEGRLVISSVEPFHVTFLSNLIVRFYRARRFGLLPGDSYVIDDRRRDLIPISEPGSSPSVGIKSSRVHVGRHEILIRSWPHPDPIQSHAAHRLIEQVQKEQQRAYGVQERKQVLVVTSTYMRALQAVHLSLLTHTLRIVPGPLIWIVVEAGGISHETAELLLQSQLTYHHLAIQEPMPLDTRHRKQLYIQSRLEGLRFIRNERLDGVVIFLDDSSTCNLELFDVVQNVGWLGTFPVGFLLPSVVSVFSNEGAELSLHSSNASKEGHSDLGIDSSGSSEELNLQKSSLSVEEDSAPRFLLSLTGPVCNSEGHMVGWHAFEEEQVKSSNRDGDWAGFAMNSRILWENVSKPSWIRGWDEVFKENKSVLEGPLSFMKNTSYVEPLGDCGQNVLMWYLPVEAAPGCKFPSRWIISPPLEVVVPSGQIPWPIKSSVEPSTLGSIMPSPPYDQLSTETSAQHVKRRGKRARSQKGKHRSRHRQGDQTKSNTE